jgi:mRNA-degrading endonuclease toxin of MazEF toxin-antitoxin module
MTTGLTRIEPKFEPREVVWGEFEFPGEDKKERPLLIISKFSINPYYQTFICLPITSITSDEPYIEKIMNNDMEDGGLTKPSQVVCNVIYSMEKKAVTKRKGKVSVAFYKKITAKLRDFIIEI